MSPAFLLADPPVESLADYLAQGGGTGLDRARSMEPSQVIEEVGASGLRGQGSYRPYSGRGH